MAPSDQHGPAYYRRGSIQVWDFVRDQGLSFHLGNAVKYICRAGFKDSKIQDLTKAIHYLQNELEHAIRDTEQPQQTDSAGEAVPAGLHMQQYIEWSGDFDR